MDGEPLLIISSDGHLSAEMEEFRPYLDASVHEAFDEFVVDFAERGSRNGTRRDLEGRLDPEALDEWDDKMLSTGRWDRFHDAAHRLEESEREGVAAEVLFPDFGGLPFQLYGGRSSMNRGAGAANEELRRAGWQAYNRWLVDFIAPTSERFAGMAMVSFDFGIEEAIAEIEWAHESGLRGIVLPKFHPQRPLYHPDFEPIWDVLEQLGMVVNSHAGSSSTSNQQIMTPGAPHPFSANQLFFAESAFLGQSLLRHFIWGGVLERHPRLVTVFTEMSSGWVIGVLESMGYARRDGRDVIRSKPSEYFRRQCFLGSSIFSRPEIAHRQLIGLDNMMLGMDMPHHEGTLLETTQEYLRATLGAEHVPIEEARQLLAHTAAKVFGFDVAALRKVAERIGPDPEIVLSPPTEDRFLRGDVHRPLTLAASS